MKMTEKEFRSRLVEAGATVSNHARILELVTEAGLEFAPEPVALPERIELREHGGIAACSLWPVGRDSMTVSERRAMEGAAADRYNAYPNLRKAAEALYAEMVRLWPDPSHLRAVEVELAKGPK